MRSSDLTSADQVTKGKETLPPPRGSSLLPAVTLAVSLATLLVGWYVLLVAAEQARAAGASGPRYAAVACAVALPGLLLPAIRGLSEAARASKMYGGGHIAEARVIRSLSREHCQTSLGYAAAILVALTAVAVVTAGGGAVLNVFFRWDLVTATFSQILGAMVLNFVVATIAMVVTLVLGLLVAFGRQLPGRAARPVRALAVAWVDIFRAVPAVVMVYIVGFGMPLTAIPVLSTQSPVVYATLALSLTYSGFAAEGFRSGIESIHPSQTAAARSLGLSAAKTWRLVVLPQAVRRIVPPLLGYYIGLQKDTSLVGFVGLIDGFAQARIYSSNYFSLTPVTVVCGFYIILTIPQTRFVDYLVARGNRRRTR